MSNQVYANSMEVSCKQAAGKSICAFPDVCMTPPQTPGTPPGVPIPYPNTGLASDCTSGSTSVQISGQEVMLKNKSYFKRSSGDEAGSAPMKGVITHKNMGKVYFAKWSMDVLIEGENVVRSLDLTTHNHASDPGQIATVYTDETFAAAVAAGGDTLPKCECCNGPAHSKSQANGDSITEAEFYSGHSDGAEWVSMAREDCPGIVPEAPPTSDPCAKYYKGIKAGPSLPYVHDAEPEQKGERRAEVRHPAQAPSLMIAWRGPKGTDMDTLVLDVLQYALAVGQSSRLTKSLVFEQEIAVGISVDWVWRFDPGSFTVVIELKPDGDPKKAEAALYAELAKVAEHGLEPRELEKAKNNLAAHLLRELATNNGRAHALGTYELMLGDWRDGLALPSQYETITGEQVRAAAAKYLGAERRSVVTLVPMAETMTEAAAS